MRILVNHPSAEIEVLTADRSAGKQFKTIYPQFSYRKDLPLLTKWEDSQQSIEKCDVAFCCLPHGTTQEIISKLAAASPVKVYHIDQICYLAYVICVSLFRLSTYQQIFG